MQNLSILWHFSNITRGVLDIRAVIYFLSLVAIFGALAYAGFMRSRLNRLGAGMRRVSSWVFAMVVLAVVWNGAAGYIPLRLDLTSERLYTLSPATKRLVRGLDDKVTIKLYASKNLPTEMALALRDV
ncbi:MAG: Gldg family protein, partial [Planctomycetes bacterium]|nr:Gldg family protein [Planctomycetota bacterium]